MQNALRKSHFRNERMEGCTLEDLYLYFQTLASSAAALPKGSVSEDCLSKEAENINKDLRVAQPSRRQDV